MENARIVRPWRPWLVAVQAKVIGIISALVGRDVEADEPLMDAGLDSLSGAELKSQMEAEFGVELPETVVFDCRAPQIMHIITSPHHPPRVKPFV